MILRRNSIKKNSKKSSFSRRVSSRVYSKSRVFRVGFRVWVLKTRTWLVTRKKSSSIVKLESVWWLREPFKGTLTFVLVTHCWSEIGSRCHLEYPSWRGALDGQLLELLHGMEWWLLLALLRLSMALSLSIFSRLTLTSSFLIWLWRNDNSCTSYLACCQVAVRLLLYYWWLLWLSVLTVFRKQHTIHTRVRLAWSVDWFVELWCFLKYACMR